jgi:hypothetical protein
MLQHLSPDEKERIEKLTETRQQNNEISWLLCDFLNSTPCIITKELMESFDCKGALSEETTYFSLLAGFCGLDMENERDKQLTYDYLRTAVKKLDKDSYAANPYYCDILIPEERFGHWKLQYLQYQSYEAFIYNDLLLRPDLKEIPRVGFFTEPFRFPAVMENDREWMAVKPNEIETMQPVIDAVEGAVVTFGLGLGYFAYMTSLKKEVSAVTIVEQDKEAIRLFEQNILPQIRQREKFEIICMDAFEYVEKKMVQRRFDYAFVDLWHDVSDGLDPYLRMKQREYLHPQTRFFYWIEDSLLSGLRWQLFDEVIRNARSYQQVVEQLSNPFLQKLATTKRIQLTRKRVDS